jgi:N-acetylglucosamine-6-phosphate deacetylase
MRDFALAADTVFDGAALHQDAAVIIAGADIKAVVPRTRVPSEVRVERMPEGIWLVPGFIDLQVNGGGDVLFNDAPSVDSIAAIARAHRRFGTTALLPTLITDTAAKMRAARAAAATAMEDHPSVLGIHFEGPFLSAERAGVHDPALIRAPDDDDLAFLTASSLGITLVTLAPECVPNGFIAALTKAGVRVALGHSAASYDATRAALSAGLRGFTHLFNAMPPLAARAPGPIAAALETASAWYGLIVDGVHVAPPMLQLALRGRGQAVLVTDAMPPVGGERTKFSLQGRLVISDGQRLVDPAGRLAGSLLDMASAVRSSVRLLGLPLPAALRLASVAPAAALGIGGRLGRLKPGYRADIVALDPEGVLVVGSWVAGKGDGTPR